MTLEQLGFVKETIDDRVLYKRPKLFFDYYEWIAFNLSYKEIEISDNINSIDLMLLNAINEKVKELFDRWLKNIKKY